MLGDRQNDLRYKLLINNFLNAIERKCFSFRNNLFMRKLPGTLETQTMMKQLISTNKPFAIIRFGLFEYMLCYQYLEKKCGIRASYSDYIRYHIAMDAGLFSNADRWLDEYSRYVIQNLNQVDILAYWRNVPDKKVFSEFYSKCVNHICIDNLYPYPFWHSSGLPDWQLMLQGKRVLVISAFSKTIEDQYKKRDKLWNYSKLILPDFELVTYQAVVTNAGQVDSRFETWIGALDFMVSEIADLEFDIALISCGAYGMPLALELKKKGFKAIQWGGCFQLWFGILGGRWEKEKKILEYANEYWTYPSEQETPPLAYRVDSSCYWRCRES